eukprot:7769591-Pyramimonas_sp.AAC.1
MASPPTRRVGTPPLSPRAPRLFGARLVPGAGGATGRGQPTTEQLCVFRKLQFPRGLRGRVRAAAAGRTLAA